MAATAQPRSSTQLPSVVFCAACALVALIAAACFLPHQSIWVDETTQLTGIRLGPVRVVKWLTGRITVPGVAADRSPPLAYWIDQLWAGVFGPGIRSMRWFSVLCVAISAGVVCGTSRRVFGTAAGLAAGMLFALSPNVITTGVEIRAYPLFLLAASLALNAFVRQTVTSSAKVAARSIAWMGFWCVVAVYLHFFGVMLACALFGATLVSRFLAARSLRPVIVSGATAGVLSLGVLPFVSAAVGLSKSVAASGASSGEPPAGRIFSLARLIDRLVAHPAMSINRVATATAIGATCILLVLAFLLTIDRSRGFSSGKTAAEGRGASRVCAGIVLTLSFGFFGVILASLVARLFQPAAPNYNIWMLPGVFVLLSAGLRPGGSALRSRAAGAAVGLLLLAELYAAAQLATHGEVFAHGPYMRIATQIQKLGPRQLILIEDGPEVETCGGVYFPIRYLFGDGLQQYVVKLPPDPDTGHVRLRGFAAAAVDDPSFMLSALPASRYVMTIRARNVFTDELKQRLAVPANATFLEPGPAAAELLGDPGWEHIETHSLLSMVGARVDLFQRRGQ